MQLKATTYEEYLQLLEGNSCSLIEEEQNLLVANFRDTQTLFSRFRHFAYLVDYSKASYLFLEETCTEMLGYPFQYFLDSGHRGFYSKVPSSDHRVLTHNVFCDVFKILKTLPPERYRDYIFSFNYRFLNAKGEYMTLMQKHSYIPGNSIGNPSGAVGIICDLTHFKTDSVITLTVEEINAKDIRLVSKRNYPVYEIPTRGQISKRELEVLKFMIHGLSSKQIADKLQLSVNTINNHRKSMLQKTNSGTSAELMSYAVKYGLL